jgi:hypothetical protein
MVEVRCTLGVVSTLKVCRPKVRASLYLLGKVVRGTVGWGIVGSDTLVLNKLRRLSLREPTLLVTIVGVGAPTLFSWVHHLSLFDSTVTPHVRTMRHSRASDLITEGGDPRQAAAQSRTAPADLPPSAGTLARMSSSAGR